MSGNLISYHGVIRKRLRLKGHPEIPPYKERELLKEDVTPSSEQTAVEAPLPQHVEDNTITPVRVEPNETDENADNEKAERTSPSAKNDTRTEAERRHEEILQAREEERLRKEASKSYREKVDVRFQTNFECIELFFYFCSDCSCLT